MKSVTQKWKNHSKYVSRKVGKERKRYAATSRAVRIKRIKSTFRHVIAPSNLSIQNNSEETLSFFENVINAIREAKIEGTIFFDLSKIEIVSVDAIMYLIAIIVNTRKTGAYRLRIKGNYPENNKAHRIIYDVGFYDYVSGKKTNIKTMNPKKNRVHIIDGDTADAESSRFFCDFVQCQLNRNLSETKFLYSMIIELMTNTAQHAYTIDTSVMNRKWYLFAEKEDNAIRFVFLDTGVGIPSTVKKKFGEKAKEFFRIKEDSKLIASALDGTVKRSETGQEYRGQGLPSIYETVNQGKADDLSVISGCGVCFVRYTETRMIEEKNNKYELQGTIFSWIVK